MSPTERYGVDWFEKALFSPKNVGDLAVVDGSTGGQRPFTRRNLPESVRFQRRRYVAGSRFSTE